jgi:DNA invertase Pin-like site-specific DNA recombinase
MDGARDNTASIPLRKIRCAVYTRKSSEEGLDLEYNSLANQFDSCEKYIQSQQHEGWVLSSDVNGNIKRYDDGGYSGGNLERPALKELIKDISLGLIDMVVVYKIDRLSRSLMDFTKLIDVFNRYNVSFISVTQNFNTNDSMGKLMLNILLSFAQFEREMTGDRIRDKIRMQKSKGMWTGGTVPLGYDNIDKKLIINKEEAKRIKLIFDTFIKTESISETLKVLNNPNDPLNILSEVVKTKSYKSKVGNAFGGISFNRGSLHKLLKNKLYTGLIHNRNTNETHNGQHKAIVDEETFDKVQKIFEKHLNDRIYDDKIININDCSSSVIENGNSNGKNKKSKNNKSKSSIQDNKNSDSGISDYVVDNVKTIHIPKLDSKVPYLLKGLMKCSCCNSILTPTYTTKRNGTVYRYYKPSKLMKHVKVNNGGECQLTSIPAEQIESIVLNQIYGILRTPSMIQKIIDDVREKQNRINRERMNKEEINKELMNNEQKNKEEINKNQTSDSILNLTEQDIINHLKNIEAVWDELFPREQMEIINILIKEIIVSRTNLKIVFNNSGFIRLIQEAGGINIISEDMSDSISDSSESNSPNNNDGNNSDSVNNAVINIPIDLRHKTGRSFITTPDGGAIVIENTNSKRIVRSNYVDNAVIKALLQAEEWKEELSNNSYMNINTIAKRENKQNSYICRILNLAFLAPDIKKAILTDKAPLGLSLKDLYGVSDEMEWEEQRKILKINTVNN